MDSTEPINSLEVLVERLLQIQPLLRAVHDSVIRHGPEQMHFSSEKAVLNPEIEALRSRHAERTAQERAEKAMRAQTLDAVKVEDEARFRRADAEA
ncbi:hypothetical protein D7B24_003304 [Verticillium nonalfalfae]|uniref:Uncharacterized protein n=1 Tax=Verticillium nonalfalfae TaxID=1051616 RepID=A0A3M9XX21_9PEZI|nr:uncharacterized protein D7B24_003304 [Verticillium nonalfalfae]RNJ52561.1 hypothetical protein D7B24_003304 [Verticillium nonalfalfae]